MTYNEKKKSHIFAFKTFDVTPPVVGWNLDAWFLLIIYESALTHHYVI